MTNSARRLKARAIAVALVLLVVGAAAGLGWAATPVLKGAADEFYPSANQEFLVWAQNSLSRPRHYDVFAKRPGKRKFRVNGAGTTAFGSGVSGSTVAYQEISRGGSKIRLFDLETRDRRNPPEGVNTDKWEWKPSISGNQILFSRSNINLVRYRSSEWQRVVLFDRQSGESRTLARVRGRNRWLMSNQVNGDYLTWESCNGDLDNCNVVRYQISAKDRDRIPNPGKQQYGGAVTSDGTVYFVRAGQSDAWKCGASVRILRYPDGGPAEMIATVPRGKDVFTMFALEEEDGSVTLYFDRYSCRTNYGDVFRIQNADTERPVVRLVSRRAGGFGGTRFAVMTSSRAPRR